MESKNIEISSLKIIRTIGTGTFGRVLAVKNTTETFALKILAINDVVKLKQVEHVKNEKSILKKVSHPFIVKLYLTSHDFKFLYMVFEYICGGELFTYLKNLKRFKNEQALFYAAEIVSVIQYLHSHKILYRDLKPENVLLDLEGHIKLTDFGFAKIVYDRTYTMCGTPEYLAPEIILSNGYHYGVDWWAFGILLFEMLTGGTPFQDENVMKTYQNIIKAKFSYASNLDLKPQAKDLISKLIVFEPTKRLGMLKNGVEDIKNHPWFSSINWPDVHLRKLKPPIKPKALNSSDTTCFEYYDEKDMKLVNAASSKHRNVFSDF